jgi:hypothetical protein
MIKPMRMRWAGHVACMGKKRKKNVYRFLVEKPLQRPRCRWENNIKINLRNTGWSGIFWIRPAQARDQWRTLEYTIMNLRVPQNFGKLLSS